MPGQYPEIEEYVAASPPVLTANRSGGSIVLSWPTNAPGFALWWATNLPATSWTSNAVPPTILYGQYTITDATCCFGKPAWR